MSQSPFHYVYVAVILAAPTVVASPLTASDAPQSHEPWDYGGSMTGKPVDVATAWLIAADVHSERRRSVNDAYQHLRDLDKNGDGELSRGEIVAGATPAIPDEDYYGDVHDDLYDRFYDDWKRDWDWIDPDWQDDWRDEDYYDDDSL